MFWKNLSSILIIACVCLMMVLLLIPISHHLTARFTLGAGRPNIKPYRPRVVLIYTGFFGSYPWEGLEDNQKFTHFKGKSCTVQNCVVSYKKEDFNSSDVVIFHARNMPSVNSLRELHNKRSPNQAWVFYIIESPAHTPDTRHYAGLFNWTMTYRRDSDIYHPYGFYTSLEVDDERPQASKD